MTQKLTPSASPLPPPGRDKPSKEGYTEGLMTQAASFTARLNPPQARAVSHSQGPLLVFAGAGSGKTRVITYRIANLIARHQVPPHRILAVTFTNKAAGEMRERLEHLIGPKVARDIWVGTFHATCSRLLRRYAADVGLTRDFVIYDDSDQHAVIARVIKDLKYDEREVNPKNMLGRILKEKQEGRGPGDMVAQGFQGKTLQEVFAGYERALKLANAVDFEDLIGHMMRLAESKNLPAGQELRNCFDHVLVDEFQDTNQVQYRLVRALVPRTRNLCAVGDDDQSIYRWRGGDVRLIRNFRNDFPDATVVKLEQNYRSTARIVRAALAVISPSLEREPKQLFTQNEEGSRITVVTARDEHDEAAYVTGRMRQLLDEGASPDQLAVFYRIHAMSRVLEESFRIARIPYRVIGGVRFFDRAEVKDLLAYLRVLLNPRSDVDLLRIINVPARGIGESTLARLTEMAAERGCSLYDALGPTADSPTLAAAPRKKLATFLDLLNSYRRFATTLTPSKLAELIFSDTGYKHSLEEENSAEADARLQNIKELIGSMREYEEEMAEAGEAATLASYLERVTLSTSAEEAKDQKQVSLMSIHSAKGLEFDHVFVLGLEDGIFPYERPGDEDGSDLEEERRLAYVALTRARKQLFLLRATNRTLFGFSRPNPPSRFLRDLPRHDVSLIVTENAALPGRRAPIRPMPSWSSGSSFHSARPASPPSRRFPEERQVEPDPSSFLDESGLPRKGTRVIHQRFGSGTITAVDGISSPPRVTVYFPSWGEKKVLLEHLKLG
ncbi:MAG: UvrD-helicase domain-containing protein [Myxococcales bacterium]|nr:UvrD-helicase domain-containing protein [Polyangiaceae bacterium]MDW8247988.1 UvrD-helicase domain-containing protein [Myxococcales bacterium]